MRWRRSGASPRASIRSPPACCVDGRDRCVTAPSTCARSHDSSRVDSYHATLDNDPTARSTDVRMGVRPRESATPACGGVAARLPRALTGRRAAGARARVRARLESRRSRRPPEQAARHSEDVGTPAAWRACAMHRVVHGCAAMKLDTSPALDALCGEYLIGTLRGAARRRFERALAEEPRVALRLAHWRTLARTTRRRSKCNRRPPSGAGSSASSTSPATVRHGIVAWVCGAVSLPGRRPCWSQWSPSSS